MFHYRLHEGPECQKAYIHHSGARHSVGEPSVVKTAVVVGLKDLCLVEDHQRCLEEEMRVGQGFAV